MKTFGYVREGKSWIYVLVKFQSKRRTCHYVGIITGTDGVISTVSFFKAIEGAKISFVKPDKEDIAEVDNEDFVRILPTPNITGGTNRLAERIVFDIDLSCHTTR
ncbi:hypothetical protein EB796_025017 [Bugula neritina]|uniref:Uncharacterized protein n=1 Tax=Bugula neritina TaxID=10212 RepID=A0A7J7IRV1_BUGNE|nr:hypothetical protein EB796_025017 [Bugula neritina]